LVDSEADFLAEMRADRERLERECRNMEEAIRKHKLLENLRAMKKE
jgi:hypothetical protein